MFNQKKIYDRNRDTFSLNKIFFCLNIKSQGEGNKYYLLGAFITCSNKTRKFWSLKAKENSSKFFRRKVIHLHIV